MSNREIFFILVHCIAITSTHQQIYEQICRIDTDTRRLERGTIQWYGKNQPLGGIVLCCADDVWQLRAVQFTCCHSCRRIQLRGNIDCYSIIHCKRISFTTDAPPMNTNKNTLHRQTNMHTHTQSVAASVFCK